MELRNPQQIEAKVNAHFRVFLILWAGILISVGLLAVLTFFKAKDGTANPTLSYALLAAGVMAVAISFVLRGKLVQQALNQKDVAALQSARIVALALCESAALFGLVDRFITGSITGWFLFGISAVGILMNFPSKDQIRNVV